MKSDICFYHPLIDHKQRHYQHRCRLASFSYFWHSSWQSNYGRHVYLPEIKRNIRIYTFTRRLCTYLTNIPLKYRVKNGLLCDTSVIWLTVLLLLLPYSFVLIVVVIIIIVTATTAQIILSCRLRSSETW